MSSSIEILEQLQEFLSDLPPRVNILVQHSEGQSGATHFTAICTQYSLSAKDKDMHVAVWKVLNNLVNYLTICAKEEIEPDSYVPQAYLEAFDRGVPMDSWEFIGDRADLRVSQKLATILRVREGEAVQA